MGLIFSKATYTPGDVVQLKTTLPGKVSIYSLSEEIFSTDIFDEIQLPQLNPGSYSVILKTRSNEIFNTALEIISEPFSRVRYGFVSEFSEDVDVLEYLNFARKFHLTAIQFYDWAYKHEFLTTDLQEYGDPLGAKIVKSKIKELIRGYQEQNSLPCGYVAVYAVDSDGWKRWERAGVFNADRKPYQLGENFLWVLDPADEDWMNHLIEQLKQAREFGFRAFHLDQYGWPKVALKKDGAVVELAKRFPILLNRIGKDLDDCTHIFNNVNDFPSESTAIAKQDAIYIEVWEPHGNFQDLADLVSKAHSYRTGKPVILSAYINAFKEADLNISGARASLALTMASISSGGASHLAIGGNGRVLHDPYYVKNFKADAKTLSEIENYYSFVVSSGDLLYDPSRVDITRTFAFGINEDIKFISESTISPDAKANAIWVRIFKGNTGLTIHFINLLDQHSVKWDEAKNEILTTADIELDLDSAGYGPIGHFGVASQGSKYQRVDFKKDGSRLKASIRIVGGWSILNVQC